MAKLPIKSVAQKKLDEALKRLEEQGKIKKKGKNGKTTKRDNRKRDRPDGGAADD